jgi:energy-coupling factor transporter ATP-binding protein EcfA2
MVVSKINERTDLHEPSTATLGNLAQTLSPIFSGNGNKSNECYINDPEGSMIAEFLDSYYQFAFLVGNRGIGKTTLLRNFFGLTDSNAIKEVIFNQENGYLVLHAELPAANNIDANNFSERKTRKMVAEILREFPEIKESFGLDKDKFAIYNDEHDGISPEIIKIMYFFENYLELGINKIKKIVFVLDNLESNISDTKLKTSIAVFVEKTNKLTDYFSRNASFPQVKLIVSLRPHTFRYYKKTGQYAAIRPSNRQVILKENPISLEELFLARYNKIVSSTTSESFNKAYKILEALNTIYDKKYGKVLINLAHLNITQALDYYEVVLRNREWLQIKKADQGTFGDDLELANYRINDRFAVIRALGCKENKAYRECDEIPNLLKQHGHKDDLICLFIVKYFLQKQMDTDFYGVEMEKVAKDISAVLFLDQKEGEKSAIDLRVHECIEHLHSKKVLRVTLDSEEESVSSDTLNLNSLLYLSEVGMQLWEMLGEDSVLFEMYREDVYRDYGRADNNDRTRTELIIAGKVTDLSYDCFSWLQSLVEIEERYINQVSSISGLLSKYTSIFGVVPLSRQLFSGLKESIDKLSSYYSLDALNKRARELDERIKSKLESKLSK